MSEKNAEQNLEHCQLIGQLEKDRNQILRMAASGADLEDTLNTLCRNAQNLNPDMPCSVLRVDEEQQTLHPIASASLPDFYCDALEGVQAGVGVGSCGTAAFIKERVIVEDINTHAYWSQYKDLAASAGLQACWSEPILGANNRIYGTFAMYYHSPKTPTEQDIQFIEVCANLAAVVFENHENRIGLIEANKEMAKSLDERSQALKRTNQNLEEALKYQHEAHTSNIALEKVQTTRRLIVGVAHEVNTPIGVALTSVGCAQQRVAEVFDWLDGKTNISKQQLHSTMHAINDSLKINESNLIRASSLLDRFKEVDTVGHKENSSAVNLLAFFKELKVAVSGITHGQEITLDICNQSIHIQQLALWRVMFQLIENSVIHGFDQQSGGVISIHALIENGNLLINYQDNGSGIPEDIGDKIFEPFYAQSKTANTLGLGLNVVLNLVKQNLHGAIRQCRAPVGARFEMCIPLED